MRPKQLSLGAGFMLTVAAGEIAFFISDLQEHVMQERSQKEAGGPRVPSKRHGRGFLNRFLKGF